MTIVQNGISTTGIEANVQEIVIEIGTNCPPTLASSRVDGF